MRLLIAILLSLLFSSVSPAYAWIMPGAGIIAEEEDGAPSVHVNKIKFANTNITDNGDGSVSVADQTGAGGGDPVLVNTVAIADAAGVDLTTGTYVSVTLAAGASPDTATIDARAGTFVDALMANNALDPDKLIGDATDDDKVDMDIIEHNAGTDITADLEEEVTEGSLADSMIVSADIKDGEVAGGDINNVLDLGGKTSFEVPNTAGDVTVDAAGEIAVDSTNKQFVVYDGAAEVAIPLRHVAQGTFDLAAQWDVDTDLWLMDLHADTYPNGIYITAITVDCTVADPTTELDANLMYCDAVAGGAFPGANATLIKAINTTTGNFSDVAVNTAVATGKTLYIDLDADPTDATTQYHVRIHYRIEED